MRRLLTLFLLCLVQSLFAGNDSAAVNKPFRFFASLQGGPPVRILSTEYIDEDSPGLVPNGTLKRYAYSIGGAVGYRITPSLSCFARIAYVRRDFLASDSTYEVVAETNDGVVHQYSAAAYYSYNEYTMRNLLVGFNARYEAPIGKLRVFAGAELAYVRYLQIVYNIGSRVHTIVNNDSLANANDYSSLRTNSFYDNETFPNINSVGLLMHTGLEYQFCPHFGISTSLLLGGFYSWATNSSFDQLTGNTSDFTDSNQQHVFISNETHNVSGYERTQFDFSPVTGLLSLNFYF